MSLHTHTQTHTLYSYYTNYCILAHFKLTSSKPDEHPYFLTLSNLSLGGSNSIANITAAKRSFVNTALTH